MAGFARSVNTYATEALLGRFVCLFVCLLRLRVPQETASLVHSLPIRPEKGLAYDVMFTSGTHAVLARDVMYTSVTHAGLVRVVMYTSATHAGLVRDVMYTSVTHAGLVRDVMYTSVTHAGLVRDVAHTHCQKHTARHTLSDTKWPCSRLFSRL